MSTLLLFLLVLFTSVAVDVLTALVIRISYGSSESHEKRAMMVMFGINVVGALIWLYYFSNSIVLYAVWYVVVFIPLCTTAYFRAVRRKEEFIKSLENILNETDE